MCLILFAYKAHPSYKLILIGNRDEFYNRPTSKAGFWHEAPHVLAGRDLSHGGTWFGITRYGRIAAITNYRDPGSIKENAPSRGLLVSEFLLSRERPVEYLDRLRHVSEKYNGFNLILGDEDHIYWYSNRGEGIRMIEPGIHGLSNHLLDTPWPKIVRGKDRLSALILKNKVISPPELFAILQDRTVAEDKDLPRTGVTKEWERMLSPIFISTSTYGTRSSAVLLVDVTDHATFMEKTYDENGDPVASLEYKLDMESYK